MVAMTKVAAYARVSTRDKEQDPETQLYLLRHYAAQRGWQIVQEYVDQASATDLRGRKAWRELVGHVQKGGLDLMLVTKLDRAFRSANHTSTSTGKLLLDVLAAVAKFEKSLIVERTKEGSARAVAQGKRLGKPPGSKDKKKRSRRGYLIRWSE